MDLVDFEYQGLTFRLEFGGCWVCEPSEKVALMLSFCDQAYEASFFLEDKRLINTDPFDTAREALGTLLHEVQHIWDSKPEK